MPGGRACFRKQGRGAGDQIQVGMVARMSEVIHVGEWKVDVVGGLLGPFIAPDHRVVVG